MNEYILKTNCLTKKFKNYAAVNEVSLHVKRGDIYGFIGKNGAGKTTFLKMISGLSTATSGEIELFGEKQKKTVKDLYSRVGVLIEAPGLYPNLTAYENMKLKCICLGIKNDKVIPQYLELAGLQDVGKKKTKEYSLGMKQRLGIAMSLIGEPDLLVLDEPINGLDPEGIVQVRETILHLNKECNITIIISSHILEELSKIANMYGIINKGKLVQEISREELMEKCNERIVIETPEPERTCTILEEKLGIDNYKVVNKNLVYVYERLKECAEINRRLIIEGANIGSISINNENLESYFLGLTGGM